MDWDLSRLIFFLYRCLVRDIMSGLASRAYVGGGKWEVVSHAHIPWEFSSASALSISIF